MIAFRLSKRISAHLLLILMAAGFLLPLAAEDEIDFARDIRPILSENCFACHGFDEKAREAKLRLDVREEVFRERSGGPVVVPGQPDRSQMIQRITALDPDDIMPPPDFHKTLTPEQKDLLTRWVKDGASWSDHWAFVSVKETPAANVDDLILKDLAKKKLTYGGKASPERLLRRLSLDLKGLPPSLDEVHAFASGQRSFESFVDEYLASPHYGERMAQPWLDGARYSDTHGLQNDFFRGIWPYRDWVINAFNDNLSYKDFTIRQLAGDLLDNPNEEDLIATGFLKCNPSTHEGGVIREEYRIKYLKDRTETFAQVWLGLTAECAGCHDHKYDPISMKDYYSLAAFFAGIDEPVMNGDNSLGGRKNPVLRLDDIQLAPEEVDVFVNARPGPRSTLSKTIVSSPLTEDIPGNTDNGFAFSFWLTPSDSEGEVMAVRQGAWVCQLGIEDGKPVFEYCTPGSPDEVRLVASTNLAGNTSTHFLMTTSSMKEGAKPALFINGVLLDVKPEEGDHVGYGMREGIHFLSGQLKGKNPIEASLVDCRVFTRQLTEQEIAELKTPLGDRLAGLLGDEIEKTKDLEPKFRTTMIVRERQEPYATHILNRGSYDGPIGDPLQADTFDILPSFPNDWKRDRLHLAKWLFLPDHPLTARVAVNRLWRQIFGEGLVKSGNDFGNQGTPPANRALLDALAADFARDWNVKRMMKKLVMTDFYQQTAVREPGRSFASRYRLDAEIIRDQVLAVSGLLNPKIGGYPVRPYQPPGVWSAVGVEISDTKYYIPDSGPNLYRRSLYTVHKRTAGPPIMANFDAPTRESCTTQRERTNTPLQALQLLNDTQFFEAARALAHRVEGHQDPAAAMFEMATCRKPADQELNFLHAKLAEFRKLATDDVHKVGEYDVKADAGLVLLANMVLNLDEVVCR